MPDESKHPTFARANELLADHYEKVAEESGRTKAAQEIKAVVHLGVEKVTARAGGRPKNEGVRHVLSEVAVGNVDLLVEEIAAEIQDLVKERGEEHLFTIPTRHGRLPFLPDVFIPMEVPVFKQWQRFLNALDAAALRVEDPVTGLRHRIPFRDGQWLGDLRFAAGAKATIAEAVTEVVGDLMLRGLEVDTTHTVTVSGSLYADHEQLRDEPSFIDILGGALRLYGDGISGPQDIEIDPDDFKDWGVGPGTAIHLNDRAAFSFIEEEGPDGQVHAMAEIIGGRAIDFRSRRFVWNGENWLRFRRELSAELSYDVLRNFRRICALLGLGDGFVTSHKEAAKALEANVERITLLLQLARGAHSRAAMNAMPQISRDRIQSLEQDLLRLKALVVGEGPEYYRDVEEVSKDIRALLTALGDNRVKRVGDDISKHCAPVPSHKVRQDREYLLRLNEGENLTFGDVLGNAGRTLVFLNNVCTSRPTRKLAANTVNEVRDALAEVLGETDGQTLLLQLLKFSDPADMARLRTEFKDKAAGIIVLEEILGNLKKRQPLEIIREFRMHKYDKEDDKLPADKALLARILGMHKGRLDGVMARSESGHGADDGNILQNALLVNLQSFALEDIKKRPFDLDQEKPSAIVAALLDKLNRYRPIMAEFNRLCGATE